jgi:cobalamin biosynthesis protein CbiG
MQVASVSEAAALKAGGVELVVTKQKSPNATLAVARVSYRS